MLRYVFPIFLLISCRNVLHTNLEKEKQEILKLEAEQRTFHLTKNARLFTNLFSDNFLSINKGVVDSPSRQESFEKFDEYFKRVEFVKWEDDHEPIIHFSDDGSLAYVVVQKIVIVKMPRGTGNASNDTTHFAWLNIYKKTDKGWKIDCVTSTNK
ncbi:MAG TPA: hypothetical protein VGI82_05825 [Chitinophagaceae bacterium]